MTKSQRVYGLGNIRGYIQGAIEMAIVLISAFVLFKSISK